MLSCFARTLAAMEAVAVAALAAIVEHDHARVLDELVRQQRQQLEQQRQQLERQRQQLRHQELQIAEVRTTNAWARFHLHTGHADMALCHLSNDAAYAEQ